MFFEAQIATQELKRGDDNLDKQGRVYLYPEYLLGADNLTPQQTLKYIKYESNDPKENTFKKKLEENSNDIREYFSVNPEGQLVLASLETTTVTVESKTEGKLFGTDSTDVTYKATEILIDYKSMISQYATPMSFYLELGMVTRNPNFLEEVVKLVKSKTNIQLTVLNTVSRDRTTQVDTETVHERGRTKVNDGTQDFIIPYSSDTTTTTTTTTDKVTVTPTVKVTSVDTWICSQKINYSKIEGNAIESDQDPIKQESEEEKSLSDDTQKIENVSWTTREDTTVHNYTKTDSYDSGIASDYVDNTDEFVKLLRKEYKIPNSKEKRTAGAYLETDAELFFQLLRQNPETQGMEQVMRYIMHKYNDKKFPEVELDFSIFDPAEYESVGIAAGDKLAEMIASYENDPLRRYMNGTNSNYASVKNYVKQDKSQYRMYYTANDGCLNFTYGIMVRYPSKKLNNEDYFSDEGIDLKALMQQYDSGQDVYVDAEIIDRIYLKIMNDRRNVIKSFFEKQGISLKQHEIDSLVIVSYQYGNCGQYIQGEENIAKLYSNYYAKGDKNSFKSKAQASTDAGGRAYMFNDSTTRKKNNWILFSEGRYILSDGTEIAEGSIGGGTIGEKSNVAQFALQFVGENHSRFTSYKPKNGVANIWYRADWCAMFVSYCYNECGLIPSTLPKPYAGCGLISELYNEKNPRVKILGNKGVFKGVKKDSYTPKSGDIIFFNWNGSGARIASHTGIVVSCDGLKVNTVEGNAVGGNSWSTTKVGTRSYQLNDGQIVGYISADGI